MKWFEKIKSNFFWLPAILMVSNAISKFLFPELWQAQFQDNTIWLGIVELCCVLIFLVPVTMRIGFSLVCIYLGGSIGANLIGHVLNFIPIVWLSLFFLSMYWKDPSFLLKTDNINNDEENEN